MAGRAAWQAVKVGARYRPSAPHGSEPAEAWVAALGRSGAGTA